MVVDDEVDSLEVATRLLRLAGAEVITAETGRDAITKLEKAKPHVIVADLSMPDMDGWELIHLLKRERRTLDIPVIALTAHTMLGDRERAMSAGFHNHISKPLDPTKFVTQLFNLLIDVPILAKITKKNQIS